MVKCRIKIATSGPRGPDLWGGDDRYGGASARATETDTGNPAFLGWHAGRRTAPAALRRLRQRLLPAAPALSGLRLAPGQRIQGQRPGQPLQRRCASPPRDRLYAALR